MKQYYAILLAGTLAAAALSKILGGADIVRPAITERDTMIEVSPVVIQGLPPLEPVYPTCTIFTDKQCFDNLRLKTQ